MSLLLAGICAASKGEDQTQPAELPPQTGCPDLGQTSKVLASRFSPRSCFANSSPEPVPLSSKQTARSKGGKGRRRAPHAASWPEPSGRDGWGGSSRNAQPGRGEGGDDWPELRKPQKTLEGFWDKGQLHSQAQTSGRYGVAFRYRGPEHYSLLGGNGAGLCSGVYLKTSTKYLMQQ